MPQLDKVTFLSQFFWLCVFFLSFYVAAIKFFLPKMSRILSYRKKRLNQATYASNLESQSSIVSDSGGTGDLSDQGVNDMQQENNKVRLSAETLLESGLKNSKDAFKLSLQRTGNWLSEYTISTNQTKLKKTNLYYLRSLGEKSLSHNLAVQTGFRDFSNTIFISVLTQKLKLNKASIRKSLKKTG